MIKRVTMATVLVLMLSCSIRQKPAQKIYAFDLQQELLKNEQQAFTNAIQAIKQHEGLVKTPYFCVAGYPTIGYGHLIQTGETYTYITEEFADSLLIQDFRKACKLAEKYTRLQGARKIAIAHFIFSLGIGQFLNSRLYKKLLTDLDNTNVDLELVKWCYYKHPKTGRMIYSSHAAKIRNFEINLWHIDDKSYIKQHVASNRFANEYSVR